MIYKKTKWTPLVLSLFILPLVLSCSSDDEEQQSEPQRYISVVVSENPLQGKVAEGRTRADAPITTATLDEFSMNYPPGNENTMSFKKEDGEWNTPAWPNIEPDPYNKKFDFYAYNGGTFQYNGGDPYVVFTTDEFASEQKDFLVATHKEISYNDHNGVVSLSFDHACAAVEFNIFKTNTISSHAIVVKSVVLKNVKNKGDYYYESGWKNLDAVSTDKYNPTTGYTLTTGDITLTTESQQLPRQWLFLIPQSKDGIKLAITYTRDGTDNFREIPIGTDSWEAGKQYTINIKVGSSFVE